MRWFPVVIHTDRASVLKCAGFEPTSPALCSARSTKVQHHHRRQKQTLNAIRGKPACVNQGQDLGRNKSVYDICSGAVV